MITEKGFELPTVEEIYQRKLADFKTVKPNIRETDSNVLIPLLKFDAAEEYDSYLQGLAVYNNLNVYTAIGNSLNAITSHLNMTWKKPQKATGKVEIEADIGTIIPQAWGIETESKEKFITLNTRAVKVEKSPMQLEIIALEAGKNGNVSAGQITKQTEIISGIKSIKNKIGTFGGADLETDTELRERYLERIDRKTSFTTEGIKNYILQNTNVKKCQVLENDTDDFDAEGRVAHSYEAICFGDTDENILQALYEYKLAGIRAVGDITKQFEEISVGFSRAIEKQIFLKVEITTIKEVWKDEFKKVINNIFINYLSEIEPAGTIYLYKLIGEIYKHTSGIKTLRLKLGDTKYGERETDYILSRKEVAIGNENNVTIVVTN